MPKYKYTVVKYFEADESLHELYDMFDDEDEIENLTDIIHEGEYRSSIRIGPADGEEE